MSDDGTWDRKILEFIHVKIVNKSVYVRVEDGIDDEYVSCTLTVGAMDLIKTLIAEKLAEYTGNLKVNLNLPVTYDFYDPKQDVRDVDLYKESCMDLEDFKRKIAKKSEAKKEKEFLNKYDFNQSIDYIVEDSDVEVVQRINTSKRDSVDYELDFEPNDTSTTISSAMRTLHLLPFKPIKLSKEVKKFPCKIYEVLDPLQLFVEPIIAEYNDKFNEMEKKIKKLYKKTGNGWDITDSRICLAPFSDDECYYRATIIDNVSKTHVRVRFVDYLNEEIVRRESLKECPPEFFNKPLKHLLVKLHGVKPARRVRDSDIKRQLDSLIGQTVTAYIVRNGEVPSVRLYDNEKPNVLAYKSLIDSNFFTETRE